MGISQLADACSVFIASVSGTAAAGEQAFLLLLHQVEASTWLQTLKSSPGGRKPDCGHSC